MKENLTIFIITALSIILSGCKPTHDSTTRENITIINSFAAKMEKVKDRKSAEKELPELQKLGKKLVALEKKKKELPKLSVAKQNALNKKHLSRHQTASLRFMNAKAKLAKLPIDVQTKIMNVFVGKNLNLKVPSRPVRPVRRVG